MDKVLIVEDDRIHLKRLTTVLGKYRDKFEVIPAVDGQEAMDILKQGPVSLMVTDIQMPRVDGLVLLAHVSEYHPNLPCFVMTAYGTPQMKARLPKDLIRFFNKPFDIEELAQAIIAVLEKDFSREALYGISLISFLQIIEMEKSSCIFEIESLDQARGMMHFKSGVLYDAECGDLKGEAAALELIPRKMATYRFKFFTKKHVTRQIQTALQDLIQKAMGDNADAV